MRRSLVTRRLALAVSYAIGLTLAACSGSDRHDPTGPDPEPIPDPAPTPAPEPTPIPQGGIQGSYALERINQSEPGQLVTIANPDGTVVGLYRFHASTIDLDALQTFTLDLNYTDDKSQYKLMDEGEFKQAGPIVNGGLPLTFYSDTYGDRFAAVATQGFVLIHYDFDGDGELETEFGFRRVD
jgi:hypothetical protein